MHNFARCVALVAFALLPFFASSPATAKITDAEVLAAIERMQKNFYNTQNKDGSWEKNFIQDGAGGETALVVYALMVSGHSHQSPPLQKAIRWLREKKAEKTYAVGIRCHVWSHLPDAFAPELQGDASWLLDARRVKNSTFNYTYDPEGTRIDHSVTQYGVLGLWEYAKRGYQVPKTFWENAVQHMLDAQHADGGWSYGGVGGPSDETRGAMTCACLTMLFIAKQQLYKERAPAKVDESIDRGLAWLDKHFGPNNFRGGHPNYYRYGVERVALASGYAEFGGKDWFETLATAILNQEGGNGKAGDNAETAFALAFLSRGRVPVWIRKLRVEGKNWNDRYNDLYNLNAWLSDEREQELLWQVADVRVDSTRWLNTPILWLSSDKPFDLTDAQKANLRQYIELGGTLVINSENGELFSDSIKALLQEFYPEYKLAPMPDNHPMLNSNFPIKMPQQRRPMVLSNGARDLAFILKEDWGEQFQKTVNPGSEPWQAMLNLYAACSNRGRLPPRLDSSFITRSVTTSKTGDVLITRAQYSGNWNPEPLVYLPTSNLLYNQSGVVATVGEMPLEKIGEDPASFVHLSGVEPYALNDAELKAVKDFIDGGGIILVETVGGMNQFASELERQLREYLKKPSTGLSSSSPIISGQGLTGGFDNSVVGYRSYTVLRAGIGNRPSLRAILDDNNRPAIIFSPLDLSVAAVGGRQYMINGYDIDSARHLLVDIILQASKDKPSAPPEEKDKDKDEDKADDKADEKKADAPG